MPLLSVWVTRGIPFSASVIVTLALGTTAPCGSVTVPRKVAVDCAIATAATRSIPSNNDAATVKRQIRRLPLVMGPFLLNTAMITV